MKLKILLALTLSFLSVTSQAGWVTSCGDVARLQTWANGTDRYGVKISLSSNPESCAGFWVGHADENKDLVYSMLLASLMAKNKVCIQFDSEQTKQDGACRLNFVYLDSQ